MSVMVNLDLYVESKSVIGFSNNYY